MTDILQESGKAILSGNEAIARGALESGVAVATGYPGSPSTEIQTTIAKAAKERGIYAEWSINEIVAFELAAGASFANKRAICSMKNLGQNTIIDFLNVVNYSGVNAGLVLVVSDDPEPISTQSALDSRFHAMAAKIPCLEPVNGQEAKEIVKYAFELSEKIRLPVQIRITTKLAYSSYIVELGKLEKNSEKAFFKKEPKRFVCLPGNSKKNHVELNKKNEELVKELEGFEFNRLDLEKSEFGIIASGFSYNFVMEALERMDLNASVLKMCSTHPIPTNKIEKILSNSKKVLVIEELEPIMEWKVREVASRTKFEGEIFGTTTKHIPRESELNVELVERAIAKVLGKEVAELEEEKKIPKRIPALCSGCSHIGFYTALDNSLKELGEEFVVLGDRGCYNIAAHPPFQSLDTCMCMGSSIPLASGFAKAGYEGNIIAVIGDSTFLHSGLTGLMNAVANNSNITVCILDNSITAMTGHQPNPGTGKNAMGEEATKISIMEMVKATGIGFYKEINPYHVKPSENVIKEAVGFEGTSVIIFKAPCALKVKPSGKKFVVVNEPGKKIGCAAINQGEKTEIDLEKCNGCSICAQVAEPGSIRIWKDGK